MAFRMKDNKKKEKLKVIKMLLYILFKVGIIFVFFKFFGIFNRSPKFEICGTLENFKRKKQALFL